jgi:hypothetical protein
MQKKETYTIAIMFMEMILIDTIVEAFGMMNLIFYTDVTSCTFK